MKKSLVVMILICVMGAIALTSCEMTEIDTPRFSTGEIADMLYGTSPYILSSLGMDEDIVINNPLGAPLLNIFDETTWEFALIGAVSGENIYLYSIELETTVLYYNGQIIYFTDWPPVGLRGSFPQLLYHDFDGDGRAELAIIVHAGSGTGVALNNLYIISFDDEGNYSVAYLRGGDVHEWMTIPMDFEMIEGTDTFRFYFAGQSYIVDCIALEGEILINVGTCSVAMLWFEDTQIKTTVAIAMHYDRFSPSYFGEVNATVVFDGANFVIKDYVFTLYEPFE